MFAGTDRPETPWCDVDSDDKRRSRINMIAHLLSTVPYHDVQRPPPQLPPRPISRGYRRPPMPKRTHVPDHAATILARLASQSVDDLVGYHVGPGPWRCGGS